MTRTDDTDRLLKLFVLLIFAGAAMLRFQNIFSALEYDEIWTFENFSVLPISKIMTELALPNNQPLNSLWVKLVVALNGPLWAIRLHSFVTGVLVLPLTGFIAFVLSNRNKSAAAACMFFMALSAPDIAYSSLARGYGLQVFFLALYGAGLAAAGTFRPTGKYLKFLPECAMAIGGLCAILTLPTSVMYLGSMTLAAWLIHPVKPGRSLVIVLGTGAVFTLFWCLSNYQQLDAARIWGSKIRSFTDFYRFLSVTFTQLTAPTALLLGCIAFKFIPRKTLPLLLIIILPLLSAVITNAGPPRTYIPFGAVFAIAGGCGLGELLKKIKKNPAAVVCILLAVSGILEYTQRQKMWYTPDSREVFKQASALPYSTLVVHSATQGYPLAWNNRPEVYNDFVKRLLEHSNELVMFDGPGRINGLDSNGSEKVLTTQINGMDTVISGMRARRYKLSELSAPPAPGTLILVALRPVPQAAYKAVIDQLKESGTKWLKLNPWLTCPINRPEATYLYLLLAGTVQKNDAAYWKALLENNGMLSIYQLEEKK